MWTKAVNKLKLWLVNVALAKLFIPICFTLSVQQDDKQSVDYTSHPLRGLGVVCLWEGWELSRNSNYLCIIWRCGCDGWDRWSFACSKLMGDLSDETYSQVKFTQDVPWLMIGLRISSRHAWESSVAGNILRSLVLDANLRACR